MMKSHLYITIDQFGLIQNNDFTAMKINKKGINWKTNEENANRLQQVRQCISKFHFNWIEYYIWKRIMNNNDEVLLFVCVCVCNLLT